MNGNRILRIGAAIGGVSLLLLIGVVYFPMSWMEPEAARSYYKSQLIYILEGTFGWGTIIGGIMGAVLLKRWIAAKLGQPKGGAS